MLQPETKQTTGVTGTPAAPSAPAVPAIRNTRGVAAGARKATTQQALKKRAQAIKKPSAPTPPAGTTRPADKTGVTSTTQPQGGPAKTDKMYRPEYGPKGQPVDKEQPSVQPNPYGEQKMDPRDENYWANRQALEASYFADIALLERDQLDDNIETNMTAMELSEYNRRRKRDMGESRLGTGGAYSGQARRDQVENDTDFMTDMMRRDRQKARRDFDRDIDRGRRKAQLDSDIRELELATAKQMGDEMLDDSKNSDGDALPVDKDGDGVADTPGAGGGGKPNQAAARRQQQLRKQMQAQTKRIQKLRERVKNADNPKQEQKLRKQIKRTQKKRAQNQGKLGKNTNA